MPSNKKQTKVFIRIYIVRITKGSPNNDEGSSKENVKTI